VSALSDPWHRLNSGGKIVLPLVALLVLGTVALTVVWQSGLGPALYEFGVATAQANIDILRFLAAVTGILAASTLAILGFFVIPFKRIQAKDRFKEKMLSLRTKLINALTAQFSKESENAIARLKDGVAPYTRYVHNERERIDKAENTLARLRQSLSELRARSQAVVVK